MEATNTVVPSLGVATPVTQVANPNGHCPECPDCGAMLAFEEGCIKCPNCGFSRCG
jgi:ribonucleoside-diphosphate reductase alpha chain